jgi:hypothetical protein
MGRTFQFETESVVAMGKIGLDGLKKSWTYQNLNGIPIIDSH